MNNGNHPDPETRWLSHVLVGYVAGVIAGKRSDLAGAVTAAIVSALLHKVLDAPVAALLTDMGT
jgi:predicted transcriptional regulator